MCKRWDDSSIMYYNQRNGFYRHYECARVEGRNNRKTKTQLSDSAPKRFVNPVVGKCKYCKTFDNKDNFYQSNKCSHKTCQQIQLRNATKMKPHKTDTCAFTGLPFGDKSEMKPVGDHDHDTLLYRGHIWSSANRLEGALKFIMQETGCSIDEVFEMAKNYLAKPGKDIGLEPYPQLGFATAEEAIEHYETTN
tara:strand:+ start:5457 stop:6035 length:579 start_codon:yes stop_codon:yes gene_type:complete